MTDNTATSAVLWLTAALVLITGYYAWQTRRMVSEMERARGAQLMPRLVLDMKRLGAGNALLRVTNAGPGPALNVDVQLALHPDGPVRRWAVPVVAAGESHDFIPDPSGGAPNGRLHLDVLTDAFGELRLQGTCADALGKSHAVEDKLDVREYWRLLKEVQETVPHEPLEEMAKHMEKLAKAAEAAHGELKALRWQLKDVIGPTLSGERDEQ
jgi:hypothetical protein